jgi:2'-5' RNA ligase
MRLFFAILLPEDVRETVSSVQAAVRNEIGPKGIRWEHPDKFHITVRFLGEVSPEQLDSVKSAGRAAAEGSTPFALRLGGIGTFPRRKPARVLWLGADYSGPDYAQLVRQLERGLAALGLDGEGESKTTAALGEPSAHITVARIKDPEAGKSVSREISKINSKNADIKAVFFVYNIVLVESELRPGGSRYTILETFPLHADAAAIDPSPPSAD